MLINIDVNAELDKSDVLDPGAKRIVDKVVRTSLLTLRADKVVSTSPSRSG